MIAVACIAVGALFAAGIYLVLSWNTQRLVMGFLLMSNAANLLVMLASGPPTGAHVPFAGAPTPQVDPLPQAFVLTAIVIGLGAAAFLLAMAVRAEAETGSDDLREPERRK